MAFLCVFQQGEFKNNIFFFKWVKSMSEKNAKKVEKKKLFSCRFLPSIFLSRFLAVSLHDFYGVFDELRFSKIRPENLKKKSQKKVGRYVAFFLLRRPLSISI
jgi:hypothetical protein